MAYRAWQLASTSAEDCASIQKQTGVDAFLAQLLAARGLSEDAASFLNGGEPLSDPFLLKDMDKAVARIQSAIDSEEKILIFGDYDADGITATALLFSYLEDAGANVFYMLPSRQKGGYGLSTSAIDAAAKTGITLMITVDNGITAHAEVDYAVGKGIDVVVTDHHLPSQTLPNAVAVVDPMREDDLSPCKKLCGAGVALKLVCALEGCDGDEMLEFYADFAAIGTVADLMPITGENRTIVRHGLDLLSDPLRPGIIALLGQANLLEKPITAENIAYAIAPRLNAAGRMDDAKTALHLLLSDDEEDAQELAEKLTEYNCERQRVEQEIACAAINTIENDPSYKTEPVLVVWGEEYHSGVVGIVSARLASRYSKPAIVISLKDGVGKASGRSTGSFNLHDAIAACEDILVQFGGHEMAAGLTVQEENIPLLRERINAFARAEGRTLAPLPICVDAVADMQKLSIAQVQSLAVLEPCGQGNRQPLFLVENAHIDAIYPVQDGQHTRLRLRSGNATFYAIQFSTETKTYPYAQDALVDVVVSLNVYSGTGGQSISARIQDIRPAKLGDAHVYESGCYERFACTLALEKDEIKAVCPTREDTAQVYRQITKNTYYKKDLRPLFAALAPLNAGRITAAIEMLLELELLQEEPATLALRRVQGAQKRNLESSEILQALMKGGA